jgi:hypothetical protein
MQNMAGGYFGSGGAGGAGGLAQVDPAKRLMDQQQVMAQAERQAKYQLSANPREPVWIPPRVVTFVPWQILTGPYKTRQLEVTAAIYDAGNGRKFRSPTVTMVLASPKGAKRPDLQALAQLCLRSAAKFYKQLYSLNVTHHLSHNSQSGMHITLAEMEPEPGNKDDGMSSEVPF